MKQKKHGWFKLLTSMRLATVLIIAIILSCVLASVVVQNETYNTYKTLYGDFFADVISALSLDHVFTSAWFFVLMFLFFINLACCTLSRFFWFRHNFSSSGSKISFAGSPIFHVGLCVVFVGVIVSIAVSKKGYYEIAVGQRATIEQAMTPFAVSLDNFTVEYYDDGVTPKQYISKMSVVSDGAEKKELVSAVNSPASYKGVSFLQHSYGWQADFSLVTDKAKHDYSVREEEHIPLSGADGSASLGVAFYPDCAETETGVTNKSNRDLNPKLVWVLFQGADAFAGGLLGVGENKNITENFGISFNEYKNYSGLQVKYDPGIKVIFLGFLLSCVGLAMRYFPVKCRSR